MSKYTDWSRAGGPDECAHGYALSAREVRQLVGSADASAAIPLLDVFVPGVLQNPLNGSLSRAHWSVKSKWARGWRDRAWAIMGPACIARPGIDPATPKRITFTANTGARWDDDNLPAAIKSVRDALIDSCVINSDAPQAGHEFVYRQQVDRQRPGVRIVVEEL